MVVTLNQPEPFAQNLRLMVPCVKLFEWVYADAQTQEYWVRKILGKNGCPNLFWCVDRSEMKANWWSLKRRWQPY